MAVAKKTKETLEFLLTGAYFDGVPEKRLSRLRNLMQIDLVWPRTGVARKSAAREAVFKKGVADFSAEEWTKRVIFREEVEGRCGIAVSITEPVTVQKIRRFLRLTAKYALRMGADFMEKAMVGYADIASSPIDALSAMVGEKDVPKIVASGVVDFTSLPEPGESKSVTIPLTRPSTGSSVGYVALEIFA